MTREKNPGLAFRLAAEFGVIVVGVLVALGVDGAREEWEETRRVEAALADVASEILDQHYTFGRMTTANLPDAVASTERLVRFLSTEGAPVHDTVLLLDDLAESVGRHRLWLRLDRYEALVASGDIRLLRDEGQVPNISATLRGPSILLPQTEELDNRWSQIALEILPLEHVVGRIPLGGYNGQDPLPYEPSPGPAALDRMVAELRSRRAELYPLAQGKLNATLANYHVFERIRKDFGDLLHDLQPWTEEPVGEGFELGRGGWREQPTFRQPDEIPRADLGPSYAEGRYTGVADLGR